MRYTLNFQIVLVVAVCFLDKVLVSRAFEDQQSERLSRDVIPEQYEVYINFPKTNGTVSGSVVIQVYCINATDKIVLHSKVKIDDQHPYVVQSVLDGPDSINFTTFTKYQKPKTDILVLKLKKALSPEQRYQFKLGFKVAYSYTNWNGIYHNTYDSHNSFFVAARPGPNGARNIFPCFDEPDFKAVFNLTVKHPVDKTVISITPVEQRKPGVTTFKQTMKISPYQLILAVGKFYHVLSDDDNSKAKIRIWSVKRGICFDDALDTAKKVLKYFETYFDLKYPNSYYDILATPSNVTYGGWGLSIIGQSDLIGNKDTMGKVISNQIAQYWLGGRVNIKTVQDTWVYQGLALYLEMAGLQAAENDYRSDVFACSVAESALEWRSLDYNGRGFPIKITGSLSQSPEIAFSRDSQLNKKAAALFSMLEKTVGKKLFQKSLQTFILYYDGCNANANDLWDIFQKNKASFDVKSVMESWTDQKGYPLISIKFVDIDKNGADMYMATQSPFLPGLKKDDPNYKKETESLLWQIPLFHIESHQTQKSKTVWLNETSVNFTVSSCARWSKFNSDQAGLYRVNYASYDWENFVRRLNEFHKVIPELDRYGLLSDAFTLSKAGIIDVNVALSLSTYLNKETNYCAFKIAVDNLQELSNILQFKPAYDNFKKYILSLFKKSLNDKKWDDRGYKSELYSKTFAILANHDEGTTSMQAESYVREYINTEFNPIPEYLREAVYTTVIRSGNIKSVWEFLWKTFYDKSTSLEEKTRIMKALAATPQKKERERVMNSLSQVKKEDIMPILTVLSKNLNGRDEVWNFFVKEFPKPNSIFKRIDNRNMLDFTSEYNEQSLLTKVKDFVNKHPSLSVLREIKKRLLDISSNIQFLKKNSNSIDSFLREYLKTVTKKKDRDDSIANEKDYSIANEKDFSIANENDYSIPSVQDYSITV